MATPCEPDDDSEQGTPSAAAVGDPTKRKRNRTTMSSNGLKAMNRRQKTHREKESKIEDREPKKTVKQKKKQKEDRGPS